MEESEIRQIIEQVDPHGKIPQSTVEELIAEIKAREINPKDGDTLPRGTTLNVLQEQLAAETDWRKRASIAARIISINLE